MASTSLWMKVALRQSRNGHNSRFNCICAFFWDSWDTTNSSFLDTHPICEPLTRLLSTSIEWNWTDEHTEGFNKLKEAIAMLSVFTCLTGRNLLSSTRMPVMSAWQLDCNKRVLMSSNIPLCSSHASSRKLRSVTAPQISSVWPLPS